MNVSNIINPDDFQGNITTDFGDPTTEMEDPTVYLNTQERQDVFTQPNEESPIISTAVLTSDQEN